MIDWKGNIKTSVLIPDVKRFDSYMTFVSDLGNRIVCCIIACAVDILIWIFDANVCVFV